MKPNRKTTDGLGVVMWWYDNGARIIKVPGDVLPDHNNVYRCEVALFGAGPTGWDYHHSEVSSGPIYPTWHKAYTDACRAAEIRRTWHAARAAIARAAAEHQPMTYQESVVAKLEGKAPKLSQDFSTRLWGCTITIPKGTALLLVKNASGTDGDLYAVADPALLVRLTGNSHDPSYRYCFVPTELVEEQSIA